MAALSSETLHASTVAIKGRAVMICGPSGSGKSDLALRLIDRGARLVSDDYTIAKRSGGILIATPPDTIAGKMEVRGIGLVDMAHVRDVPVGLIVELFDTVHRMPTDLPVRMVAGVEVPVIRITPHHCSAPIKLEMALEAFGLAVPAPDGGGNRFKGQEN